MARPRRPPRGLRAARRAHARCRHRRQPRSGRRPHGRVARVRRAHLRAGRHRRPRASTAIASEGATVTVVDGTYDDAVVAVGGARDRRRARGVGHVVARLRRGPALGDRRLRDDLRRGRRAARRPRALHRPTSCSCRWGSARSLASAVEHAPPAAAAIAAVEPATPRADTRPRPRGHPVEVPGPHRSIMVGLNCGNVSIVAWPVVESGRRRVRHGDRRRRPRRDARARDRRHRRRRDRGRGRGRGAACASPRRNRMRASASTSGPPRARALHRGRDRPRQLRAHRR